MNSLDDFTSAFIEIGDTEFLNLVMSEIEEVRLSISNCIMNPNVLTLSRDSGSKNGLCGTYLSMLGLGYNGRTMVPVEGETLDSISNYTSDFIESVLFRGGEMEVEIIDVEDCYVVQSESGAIYFKEIFEQAPSRPGALIDCDIRSLSREDGRSFSFSA